MKHPTLKYQNVFPLLLTCLALAWASPRADAAAVAGEAPRVIFCGTADATSNLASETTIMPTGVGTNLIYANYWKPGGMLHIKAGGAYCTGSSGTLVVKVKLGDNVLITGPTLTPVAGITNGIWRLEADLICRSVSANVGTFVANGVLNTYPSAINQNTNSGLANFAPHVVTGMATNPSPVTLYVNTNLTVGLTATWSATGIGSGMSNVISTHDLTLLHTR